MTNFLLNILSLGIKPLYEKQRQFHDLIADFRNRFANPGRANMVKSDIKEFYNKLDTFDFRFMLFKDYYHKQIENLNRFRPDLIENDFDLNFLRIALEENKWKPTTPFDVFIHHLKYEYKLSAKPFISQEKKKNLKRLNNLQVKTNIKDKPKSSQNWTRIPIGKNKDEA